MASRLEVMASRLESYLRQVIAPDSARHGFGLAMLRGMLFGFAGLYEAGLECYLRAEQIGLRRRGALPIPVVSIGNLTVGGTGKTPMTQWLCRRLAAQGKRVAILSRGHGGDRQGVRLVSDERGHVLLSAAEAGDEPTLLAQTLPGVPVLVGKDRRLSGREALRRFALDAFVLDDGFQFWQLVRDLDIVLLDSRKPFDNGYPLPRGLLREPIRHLRRAAIVVATRADRLDANQRDALRSRVAKIAPEADFYFASHHATGLLRADLPRGQLLPLETLRGKSVIALSGIAQPDSFARTLVDATGAIILHHLSYEDHQRYGVRELKHVRQIFCDSGASALVMTEKDAVKWPIAHDADPLPLYALRIEIGIDDEPRFMRAVMARLFRQDAKR